MTKLFCCNTALGKTTTGAGKGTASSSIGHFRLGDNKSIEDSYWEVHNWIDNKQMMPTKVLGPYGTIMRPRPSVTRINPNFGMSWAGDTDSAFTIKIGTVAYNWKRAGDPIDPDRFECNVTGLPGEWGTGFGYFADNITTSPSLLYDPDQLNVNSLPDAYYGEQFQSGGGVWQIVSPRRGAGLSVYQHENKSGNVIYTLPSSAGDGTGLNVMNSVAFNCVPHSNLWFVVYGGHDYNRDRKISTLDGGHSLIYMAIRRNGILDRVLYVENSYQILNAIDQYHGWIVNGNIVCIAYGRGVGRGIFTDPLELAA